MDIFNSATKIVLLMLTGTLCVLVFLDPNYKDIFANVIVAVVSFYFGQKTNQIISDAKTLTVENKDKAPE